ncbi:DUF6559 family protein [Psychrosphaera saromensis]|uniref:DUF6559 family protein n=1 Tax=Psychrosphaera saromensis TaxID=716813 RepID=UPI0027E4543D|nr:DUF6559 family protein [Psychrosphaera saromensis]
MRKFEYVSKFFKKRKIKKYARKLPQDLKAKYGYKQYYSKAEVDSAIKRKKIGNSRGVVITANCYAYAMYCSPEEFKKIHDSAGKNFDYSSMRSDVSDILFNGASDFSFSTIVYVSSISDSTSSGGFGSGGASSGFDGGDSGGGGE